MNCDRCGKPLKSTDLTWVCKECYLREHGITFCRVCGIILNESNVADPLECPDECRDCFTEEFPEMFG